MILSKTKHISTMPLVGSLVIPHGAMTFEGGLGCTAAATKRVQSLPEAMKDDCKTLYKASTEAADMAKATKPDVIFLSTPHGICLSDTHCVYLNSQGKGTAEWQNQWTEYDINVNIDVDLAKKLVEHLNKDNIKAEGMCAYSACEAPLRWGEVIPLWFFRDLTTSGVKVVIFSEPLKRNFHLPQAANVGRSISEFISGLEQRVLYMVSGDLAHSHETDCTLPLYLPDPRWNMPKSDQALPFDLCAEHWVRCTPFSPEEVAGPVKTKEKHFTTLDATNIKNAECWLSKAMDLKHEALSCGIYGMGVLHGILAAEVEKNVIFDVCLLCRLAPTYFGMLTATFIPKTVKLKS